MCYQNMIIQCCELTKALAVCLFNVFQYWFKCKIWYCAKIVINLIWLIAFYSWLPDVQKKELTLINASTCPFFSRSLYYKKGFELIGSYQRRFAGNLVGLNMFRLAKKVNPEREWTPCSRKPHLSRYNDYTTKDSHVMWFYDSLLNVILPDRIHLKNLRGTLLMHG